MTPDSITPVSIASIIAMLFTLLICIVIPIAACIIAVLKWKGKSKISSFFIGAATFILFAMILERILHAVVLRATGTLLTGNIWLYAIYGGVAAGLFEETGRFLAMKYCMKNTLNRENAILYGIGHGGIEAILIVSLTYVNNLVYSLLINSGSLPTLLSAYDADTQQAVLQQLTVLGTTPSYLFYMAGMERINAMLLHVVLSYLVYLAVKNRKTGLYVLSIFLHALLDAGMILLSGKLPLILCEAILFAAVLFLAFVLYQYEKRHMKDDPNRTSSI